MIFRRGRPKGHWTGHDETSVIAANTRTRELQKRGLFDNLGEASTVRCRTYFGPVPRSNVSNCLRSAGDIWNMRRSICSTNIKRARKRATSSAYGRVAQA